MRGAQIKRERVGLIFSSRESNPWAAVLNCEVAAVGFLNKRCVNEKE